MLCFIDLVQNVLTNANTTVTKNIVDLIVFHCQTVFPMVFEEDVTKQMIQFSI